MSKQRSLISRPLFVIGVLCVLSVLSMPPLPARAASTGPLGQPAEILAVPPRPPAVTPTPRPLDDAGAIELRVQFLPGAPSETEWRENLWTNVQWQDGIGDWHTVEGWQASLDEVRGDSGRKIWYVSKDLLGRGPFCWVIRPGPEGDPIAVSSPFRLPGSAGVIVQTDVSLGKPGPVPALETGAKAMAPVTGSGERRFTGLQVLLPVILIVLLVGSLLYKGARRR